MKDILENAFMFRELQPQEKETVINAMEEKTYKSEEDVIKQGDSGSELYIVEEGSLSCYKK